MTFIKASAVLAFTRKLAKNLNGNKPASKPASRTLDISKPNPSTTTQSLGYNPKQYYSSYSSQEFADKGSQGSEFFNMTKQRGTLFGN